MPLRFYRSGALAAIKLRVDRAQDSNERLCFGFERSLELQVATIRLGGFTNDACLTEFFFRDEKQPSLAKVDITGLPEDVRIEFGTIERLGAARFYHDGRVEALLGGRNFAGQDGTVVSGYFRAITLSPEGSVIHIEQ